ncbi:hypothetical protein BGZ96_004522 [Linnemannia gamsii]|uniref:F-box domain-containing protein n=1 Tax=Linnemannia gamsii TaxID=64522 RepID=A0ABQ7K796_9FUNG|nr:hypothetical protein BGZ96_004522 [Linnemannia gamsii]
MPFYGLPPEILQHIASFLPFHGLVRLYTCLPKSHRPIFQLLLDHSLALMMLTLEIRQQSDEVPPMRDSFFVSLNNNPNGVGAARKLQTHWRVTDFDLDRMRVEFQLEEKLGLEMAERRKVEVEYQIRQQLQLQQKGRKQDPLDISRRGQGEVEDIENLIWRTRTGGMSSSSSTSSLSGTLAGEAGGLEHRPSEVVEVSDTNFFHCNGSSHTPTLGSATVSFKAQRNMPAPWISQNFDFGADYSAPSSSTSSQTSESSPSSSSAPAAVEMPAIIRARERVAAYQQNRLLLRALAKLRSCEESSKLQFLPVTVELETEELGQKKVEAEVVDGAGASVRQPALGLTQQRLPKAVLLTTSKQLDPSTLAAAAAAKAATPTTLAPKRRSFSNMVAGYRKGKTAAQGETPLSSNDKGKGKGKATSTVSSSPSSQEQQQQEQEEEHQKLFEFSYGVRHNYLHSHRLEGERVIRPMRFACSLDFFMQN